MLVQPSLVRGANSSEDQKADEAVDGADVLSDGADVGAVPHVPDASMYGELVHIMSAKLHIECLDTNASTFESDRTVPAVLLLFPGVFAIDAAVRYMHEVLDNDLYGDAPRPLLALYSTELPFSSYIAACPKALKEDKKLFKRIVFLKWVRRQEALQEATLIHGLLQLLRQRPRAAAGESLLCCCNCCSSCRPSSSVDSHNDVGPLLNPSTKLKFAPPIEEARAPQKTTVALAEGLDEITLI